MALVLLITLAVTASLAHVAATWAQISMRHKQTAALFLAEAGIQKAGQMLLEDRNYSGETSTRLTTGCFDVRVSSSVGGYVITSTGYADSAFKTGRKKTVQATIRLSGARSFRVVKWRENP